MPKLAKLMLQQTRLSGSMSPQLGTLDLTSLFLSSTFLSGSIPNGMNRMTSFCKQSSACICRGCLSIWLYVDAHNCHLSGVLPESLHRATDLQKLLLNNNSMSGSVPATYTALSELQVFGLRESFSHLLCSGVSECKNAGMNRFSGSLVQMKNQSKVK